MTEILSLAVFREAMEICQISKATLRISCCTKDGPQNGTNSAVFNSSRAEVFENCFGAITKKKFGGSRGIKVSEVSWGKRNSSSFPVPLFLFP